MYKLKIYEDSTNYTCQVIKLPVKIPVKGLDNLVEVNIQGNSCLISKDSDENCPYLFFPSECKISAEFLSANNLYRHNDYNLDKSKKGFFEDNGRVKAIKFKGIISSGFVIPLTSLSYINKTDLKIGDEFNSIDDINICQKYIKQIDRKKGMSNPKTRVIDQIVDSRFAPEHPDTSHLLKNCHKLNLDDYIAVTYKLHGTSARYYNTLTKRKLNWKDKIAKFLGVSIQKDKYEYISASRRVLKSIGFEELPNKNHYFNSGDLWSAVGKEFFEGNLLEGEAVYCEIIGKTYTGEIIQHGYSYGFEKPKVYIYRISMINTQGTEIDLSYHQMKERAKQLNIEVCPELFYGKLSDFILKYDSKTTKSFEMWDDRELEPTLNRIFYDQLLEKPSILDNSVVEEGFCLRVDGYPKPEIFKIKSKQFLLHEGVMLDKETINLEDEQTTISNL